MKRRDFLKQSGVAAAALVAVPVVLAAEQKGGLQILTDAGKRHYWHPSAEFIAASDRYLTSYPDIVDQTLKGQNVRWFNGYETYTLDDQFR